jgi:hypothetical protein
MRWPLARFQRVRFAWIKPKAAKPIIHDDAGIAGNDSGTKGRENTLD